MFLAFDSMSLITPDLGLVFWTTIIFLTFWFIVGKKAIKPIAKAIEDCKQFATAGCFVKTSMR